MKLTVLVTFVLGSLATLLLSSQKADSIKKPKAIECKRENISSVEIKKLCDSVKELSIKFDSSLQVGSIILQKGQ